MKMTHEEFCRTHPVVQAFHTGLWGYERVYDCVNLNRCIYKSERAAKLAREKAYREHVPSAQAPEHAK